MSSEPDKPYSNWNLLRGFFDDEILDRIIEDGGGPAKNIAWQQITPDLHSKNRTAHMAKIIYTTKEQWKLLREWGFENEGDSRQFVLISPEIADRVRDEYGDDALDEAADGYSDDCMPDVSLEIVTRTDHTFFDYVDEIEDEDVRYY